MSTHASIPGYAHGRPELPRSPITPDDLALMKKSVLFDDDDVRFLRMSHDVLADQVEAILDVWYGFVGANPHLLASFTSRTDGQPLGDYLDAVRKRFGRWILDTARAEYDRAWLDYQHEIGRRHHRAGKNRTDGAAASEIVPFRDLFLLVFPITHTLKPFLAKGGHSFDEVDRMHQAWVKSCLLQVSLGSHPSVRPEDF